MNAADVTEIFLEADRTGIKIWIDGGWAVDAVLGRETRPHNDLDIAIEAKSVAAFRGLLARHGFTESPSGDASEWNFVLSDQQSRRIDVHVVVLDARDGVDAAPLEGIAYLAGSLTGSGVIADVTVRCVRADFLLQFKTSYPPRPVDRADVAALCRLLNRPVPETHQ